MKPTIEKIWLSVGYQRTEIRLDWSNNRHHAVMVKSPTNNKNISIALREMAENILIDEHLN